MELGFHVWSFDVDGGAAAIGSELARVGEATEASGATWLSVMDHYFQMEHAGVAEDPMLEGYTTLGYLAGHTSSVELGLLVTGVTYRHPGLLAKIATTLDVLSAGRGTLGLGAAWYEREHHALGVPYPPVAERFERTEETLQICYQMWDEGNNGRYDGKHYQLAETLNSPQSVSRPRPRVMIGGGGEKKTLRLVAQYADTWNATPPQGGADEVAHKLDVLKRHCENVGTDYERIRKTVLTAHNPVRDGDDFVRAMADYAKLGVTQVMVMPPAGGSPARWIEQATPAVRRLAEL